MMVLLTEIEVDKAYNEHLEYTHNSIRRRAVAKAQLKNVVEWIKQEGSGAYIYEGEYTYNTKCDNVIILDLGDLEALLKEVEE